MDRWHVDGTWDVFSNDSVPCVWLLLTAPPSPLPFLYTNRRHGRPVRGRRRGLPSITAEPNGEPHEWLSRAPLSPVAGAYAHGTFRVLLLAFDAPPSPIPYPPLIALIYPTQSLRVYLSPDDEFDYGRDHPHRLVWDEEGLSYDWAEGNTRQRSLNVSRAAVLGEQQRNASSSSAVRTSGSASFPSYRNRHTFIIGAHSPTAVINNSIQSKNQQVAYYAHVFFTRTDFPFDPENRHTQTYKRVREYIVIVTHTTYYLSMCYAAICLLIIYILNGCLILYTHKYISPTNVQP